MVATTTTTTINGANISSYRVIELSSYRIIELSSYLVILLSCYRVIELVIELSSDRVIEFLNLRGGGCNLQPGWSCNLGGNLGGCNHHHHHHQYVGIIFENTKHRAQNTKHKTCAQYFLNLRGGGCNLGGCATWVATCVVATTTTTTINGVNITKSS